ncbi:LCP family protein [Streptomyces boncukensis]|uniref:LCP family protein n=1 Tax=Streptomyces boncukensis TaxID=2711219 RepID=A0A6G4X3B6_9ACTN|nr:LCP family protein [Streptomyces boncukensis]NGO71380.1 LCP family protein [Streptomyces boncukensis]
MPDSRAAARGRRTRHRARKGRKARIAGLITLAVMVLVSAAVGWGYFQLNRNITTFSTDGLSRHRPKQPGAGQNVLVIGSDARTGGNEKLGGGDKDDIGRSDTAFLLHIYGDDKHAVAVSIPRDTLVDIPPCRKPDGTWTQEQPDTMFNAAFSVGQSKTGNPACTQNTVEKLTGLRVDHTVVIDFEGFASMTKAVGGVPVCVPKDVYQGDLNPHRDARGKRLFRKGEQTVSGQRALDYVRIRHGIGDGSDIGRIKRQQAFVGSLIKKVKGEGLNPTTLLPLADAATKSMTVDEGLGTPKKMMDFAMSLKSVDLDNTRFRTVPWRYDGNRVAVVQPDADELFADLRADRVPGKQKPVTGKGVQVTVYNGTLTPGLAASAADELRSHDYTVAARANAPEQDHATTVVTYGPGEQARAETLARLFPGATTESTSGSGLSVTLGADYKPDGAKKSDGGGGGSAQSKKQHKQQEGRSAADNPCSDLSYG